MHAFFISSPGAAHSLLSTKQKKPLSSAKLQAPHNLPEASGTVVGEQVHPASRFPIRAKEKMSKN